MSLPYPTTEDRAYIHTFNIECSSPRNEHSIVQSFWMVAEHEFISVAELPRFVRIESVLVDLPDGAVRIRICALISRPSLSLWVSGIGRLMSSSAVVGDFNLKKHPMHGHVRVVVCLA